MTHDVTLRVNGRDYRLRLEARKTLADALRDDCGLTGTHLGCEHGVCGACTVILDDEPVRSCLLLAVQCDGVEIRTVEGLASNGTLHPVQRAFRDHHALQCGFCTPGFLTLVASALERNPDLNEKEIVELLSSNLCRCTGYRNIIEAAKGAAEEMRSCNSRFTPASSEKGSAHEGR